jgi:hypothetical protein
MCKVPPLRYPTNADHRPLTAIPLIAGCPETVAAFLAGETRAGLVVSTLRLLHTAIRYLNPLAAAEGPVADIIHTPVAPVIRGFAARARTISALSRR